MRAVAAPRRRLPSALVRPDPASLVDLDQGDLKFHTDFRRVYATLLEDALGVPAGPILGGKFEKLPLLRKSGRV